MDFDFRQVMLVAYIYYDLCDNTQRRDLVDCEAAPGAKMRLYPRAVERLITNIVGLQLSSPTLVG
jgi:hypothetical protein